MRGLMLMAALAMSVLFGCSSLGMTAPPTTSNVSEVTVEVGEPEIEIHTQTNGCVETIEELPSSYVYRKDNYPQSDHLIVILKQTRRLMLFQDGKLRHDRAEGAPSCWHVGLGPSPVFDKFAKGDGRTPVGLFHTSDKPWSSFYGAILIHYPSLRHAKQAHRQGRINQTTLDKIARAQLDGTAPPQNTPLGGDILIHGGGSSSDWTLGCIALQDNDIDELRSLLPNDMKTWILIIP